MKTDRDSWIKIENGDSPCSGNIVEFKLAGTLKRKCLFGGLFIAGIHFFAYQQVFHVLVEDPIQVVAFSLLYAAGIGLLSWQCLNFFIHLQLVHLQTLETLRAHAIEVSTAFEWMRPSFGGLTQVSLGCLLLACAEWGLSGMFYQLTHRGSFLILLGLIKFIMAIHFKKRYRQKRILFNHLVGDYALTQQLKTEKTPD